jgi:hypothetical protein
VAHKGERRNAYRVLVGKPEGDNLKDLGVEGRILKRAVNKVGVNWTYLVPDREKWRALVNAVVNFRVTLSYERCIE